ncbi:MAG: ATP-binding protein, partial [bacterium]|nr:ATP-binding protein [bacterium]
MEDLSLHILDISDNSIAAGASEIKISINEDTQANTLLLEIKDNGAGLDEEMREKV